MSDAPKKPADPAAAKPADPAAAKPADPAAAKPADPAAAKPADPAAPAAPPQKLKPLPFTLDQINEQKLNLHTQRDELNVILATVKGKLVKVQTSIRENDNLRVRITQLMGDSYGMFLEEWKRKSELYPEIRYQMIEKAVESLTPKKK